MKGSYYGDLAVILAVLGALFYLFAANSQVKELGRITFACAMFSICFHFAALLVRL